MRYRKKPVVIDAVLWDGNPTTLHDWLDATRDRPHNDREMLITSPGGHITIRTLEGDMRADVGDWIICGVQGEFYPCKPDIFEATYEREPNYTPAVDYDDD